MTTRADVVINLAGLLPARRAFDRLSRARTERLLDILGGEAESQTRRRITEEKTDAAGEKWEEWSDDYAARRPAKGGLLDLDGDLADSITYIVGDDVVEVGSNLVYAHRHQVGDEGEDGGIPARPYLGVSEENLRDFGDLVMRFLEKELLA